MGKVPQLYAWIAAIVVILLFIVGVFFVGKKIGKDKPAPKPKRLPNSGSGIPSGWSQEAVAKRADEAFSDWFVGNESKTAVLGELLGLSDDQLTAVYNRYNEAYGDGDTLYEVIDDEWTLWASTPKTELLARMRSMNLT